MKEDSFGFYETGIQRLLEALGNKHPQFTEALVLQSRLLENISSVRRFGDTETNRAERASCMYALNHLAVRALGVSFNDLCIGMPSSSEDMAKDTTDHTQPDRTRDYRASAQSLLAELRRQLERLESLRGLLGDELTDQKQLELENQISGLLETSGGAFFAGDVQVEYGDLVGRDKWQLQVEKVSLDVPPEQIPPESLLQAYLRALAAECSHLPLGVVDPRFVQSELESPVPLPAVYVDLDVLAPVQEEQEDDGTERTKLLEALMDPRRTHVVLLGEPGSGKTTFINHLTYALATGVPINGSLQGMLPVRLMLREVVAGSTPPRVTQGSARVLWNALRADLISRLGEQAANTLFPYLQRQLLEDGGWILLDGLDEVSVTYRQYLLESVVAFALMLPPDRSRVLVTSRPYAYADPRWRLPGFQVLALAPFNDQQVMCFITRWYEAIRSRLGWDEATAREREERLRKALAERPDLADLATLPLLLALMATVHTTWGQLPEDRADLYEQTVTLLLGRWQLAREAGRPTGERMTEPGMAEALRVSPHHIRAVLHRLAYAAQKRQETSEQRNVPDCIREDEILAALASELTDELNPAALLRYLETRAGLLVGLGSGVYAFPHRSFQEYLAACYLVEQLNAMEALSAHARMDPLYWGEIFLLGVGRLRNAGLGQALSAVMYLLPKDADQVSEKTELDWRIALLAGQAILDVIRPVSVLEYRSPIYIALLARIRRWLEELIRTPRALPESELGQAYEIADAFFAQEAPEKPLVLDRLGETRYIRYVRTDNLADLEAAVLLFRRAIELGSVTDPDYTKWLGNLAAALHDLYSKSGETSYLLETVEIYRRILSLSADDLAHRVTASKHLGRALCALYKQMRDVSHLEEAVTIYERAIPELPQDSEDLCDLRKGLASAQHLYTLHRFFALWSETGAEDTEQRIRQFCELLASFIGVPLSDFHAWPGNILFLGILDLSEVFHNTPLPSADSFPILFSTTRNVESDYPELVHRVMVARLGPNNRRAVLVPLSDEQVLVKVRNLASGSIKQAYAYDFICLSRVDLERILESTEPQNALRHLILSQADLASIPFYDTSGPTPSDMFFGRERELQELCDHVASTSYVLIGGRRIGKTSILKQLERVRLPESGFHTFYHDCSYTPTQTEMLRSLVADGTWFPEPPSREPSSLAEVMRALPCDRLLVILLDEADKLIGPDRNAGYPIFSTLRALSVSGRCRYILCGERALRIELTDPDSPLYNFGKEMLIGRLEHHAVVELVTRPMRQLEIALADEDTMVQRIWDFTAGHPSIAQSLCRRLITLLSQRGDRLLALADVEAVIANSDFLRKDFLNIYWERATVLERLCSLVMAAKDNVRTLAAVREALLSLDVDATLNQVDDALERLVDLRNILQRTPEGYEFTVIAFPEVIAKTARLNDWIALNRETYQSHGDVEPRSKRGVP